MEYCDDRCSSIMRKTSLLLLGLLFLGLRARSGSSTCSDRHVRGACFVRRWGGCRPLRYPVGFGRNIDSKRDAHGWCRKPAPRSIPSRGILPELISDQGVMKVSMIPTLYRPRPVAMIPLAAAAQQAPPPAAFDTLVTQAAAARDQDDLPRAVALLRQAVALNPQWPDGWWYLGMLGYSASDYASAVDAFTHYLQLVPSAGPAFALRGLCEFGSADYTASLDDILRAVSLGAANDARNAQILLFHEALLLAHASRFEEALGVYQTLVRTAPPNPELLAAFGLAGLRDPTLPRDASLSQTETAAAAGQAGWEFVTGNTPAAAQAFTDFFARYPTLSNAHYFYAYLLFGHDPDAAVLQLQQALRLNADSVPALTLVAWAHILDNTPAGALPYARKAEGLDPDLFMTQLVLGRALVGTDDLTEGLDHLQQALRMDPENVEVHIGLAIAYSKSGKRDLARRERVLSLALTRQPQDVYSSSFERAPAARSP